MRFGLIVIAAYLNKSILSYDMTKYFKIFLYIAGVTILLLILAVSFHLTQRRQRTTSQAQFANVDLILPQPSSQYSVGQEILVELKIKSAGASIAGVDVEVTFDSGILDLVQIEPASIFPPETVLHKDLSTQNNAGIIRFTAVKIGNTAISYPLGEFTVASVTFKAKKDAPEGTTVSYKAREIVGFNPDANSTDKKLATNQTQVTQKYVITPTKL